jgi:hypothetical protein
MMLLDSCNPAIKSYSVVRIVGRAATRNKPKQNLKYPEQKNRPLREAVLFI